MADFREEFESEVERLQKDTILSPKHQRKRLIVYVIRTVIAAVLFYVFWKHKWVRWVLVFYIPLNLISLASIFGWNYVINKKIAKTRQRIEELDDFEEE